MPHVMDLRPHWAKVEGFDRDQLHKDEYVAKNFSVKNFLHSALDRWASPFWALGLLASPHQYTLMPIGGSFSAENSKIFSLVWGLESDQPKDIIFSMYHIIQHQSSNPPDLAAKNFCPISYW